MLFPELVSTWLCVGDCEYGDCGCLVPSAGVLVLSTMEWSARAPELSLLPDFFLDAFHPTPFKRYNAASFLGLAAHTVRRKGCVYVCLCCTQKRDCTLTVVHPYVFEQIRRL